MNLLSKVYRTYDNYWVWKIWSADGWIEIKSDRSYSTHGVASGVCTRKLNQLHWEETLNAYQG